ncbi:MAG: ABC transporter permease [Eubacterium sp.]|jgi:peptide/nickel transport system permease protein|nr:ABC transporter permease [Eubacterium sp.]
MSYVKYIGKRLIMMIPQLLGIMLVSFLLVRMLPGNPATAIAGSLATEETVRAIEHRMGLDQPIYIQFGLYLKNVMQGDLGTSWYTSSPVSQDLTQRFPATLEIVSLSMILAILIGVLAGILATIKPKGIVDRISKGFSMVAGALPEFWLGLLFIYFLYVRLKLVAAPLGRLDLAFNLPPTVTGMILLDTLIAGDFAAFGNAVSHMLLPVATLSIVLLGPILKMTRSSMREAMGGNYVYYAKMCGMKSRKIVLYAFRSALPPIVTIIAVYYGFMLGGAVLIEQVFGWGGLGQYAVQAVVNKDFNAIQGFLVLSAVFSLFLYLIVDIVYMIIDPRIRP